MRMTAHNKRLIQREFQPVVARLLAARAVAQTLREKMDPIYNAILAAGDYRNDEGEKVLDHNQAYRILDSQIDRFWEECEKAKKDAGFDLPHGHCPALVAEDKQRKIEQELIDLAVKLIDPAFGHMWNLEHRRKAIDLFISMALAK